MVETLHANSAQVRLEVHVGECLRRNSTASDGSKNLLHKPAELFDLDRASACIKHDLRVLTEMHY